MRTQWASDHDGERKASAGIVRVVHVISAVHVVDVDVVGVVPAGWPGFDESKPITAVVKARVSADQSRRADVEFMPASKIGMEARV